MSHTDRVFHAAIRTNRHHRYQCGTLDAGALSKLIIAARWLKYHLLGTPCRWYRSVVQFQPSAIYIAAFFSLLLLIPTTELRQKIYQVLGTVVNCCSAKKMLRRNC